MTTATLLSILIPALSFLAGHFHVILPAPQPTAPLFPNTFGHGELIRFLQQTLANLTASVPQVPVVPFTPGPVVPVPVAPGLDLNQVLAQILDFIKATHPNVQPPVPPKVV